MERRTRSELAILCAVLAAAVGCATTHSHCVRQEFQYLASSKCVRFESGYCKQYDYTPQRILTCVAWECDAGYWKDKDGKCIPAMASGDYVAPHASPEATTAKSPP